MALIGEAAKISDLDQWLFGLDDEFGGYDDTSVGDESGGCHAEYPLELSGEVIRAQGRGPGDLGDGDSVLDMLVDELNSAANSMDQSTHFLPL